MYINILLKTSLIAYNPFGKMVKTRIKLNNNHYYGPYVITSTATCLKAEMHGISVQLGIPCHQGIPISVDVKPRSLSDELPEQSYISVVDYYFTICGSDRIVSVTVTVDTKTK